LCYRKIKNDTEERSRSRREGVKEKGEQQGADPRADCQVRQDRPWVPAQEADRRRIGKDRLLGEGDRRNIKKHLRHARKGSRKGNGHNQKEAWRAHPYQAREKKADRPRGCSK